MATIEIKKSQISDYFLTFESDMNWMNESNALTLRTEILMIHESRIPDEALAHILHVKSNLDPHLTQ